MIIPEKIKEPRSKKFSEFKDRIENIETLSKKSELLLLNYAERINGLKRVFDTTIEYITEMFNEGLKTNLALIESRISFKKKKKTVEFSIGKIKNMSGIKDCFMEKETLCVITEEVEHKTYRGKAASTDLKYIMPSYKIIYSLREINDFTYEKGIEEEYKINNIKITLGYRVQLADEDHISMFSEKEKFKNNQEYLTGVYQSPYQNAFNVSTKKDYIGCGDVCFGDSDTEQRKHLLNLDLISHLLGLLQTLYTEDTTGRGYSSWKYIISYEKSLEKTIQLKEKIGDFEGVYRYRLDDYGDVKCYIEENWYENYLTVVLNEDSADRPSAHYDEVRIRKIIFDGSSVGYFDLVFHNGDEPISQRDISIKEIKSIETPNGSLTADEFNQIIKEIYESDTAVVSEG